MTRRTPRGAVRATLSATLSPHAILRPAVAPVLGLTLACVVACACPSRTPGSDDAADAGTETETSDTDADDGDDLPAEDCDPIPTSATGRTSWFKTYETAGSATEVGIASDVTLLTSGNLVVAGRGRFNSKDQSLVWAAAHTPDGEPVWSWSTSPWGDQVGDVSAVAIPSGGFAVVAHDAPQERLWLARFDDDGAKQWEKPVSAPAQAAPNGWSTTDYHKRLSADAESILLMGSTKYIAPNPEDGHRINWLVRVDPESGETEPVWSSQDVTATGYAVYSQGYYILGLDPEFPSERERLWQFESDGAEVWSETLEFVGEFGTRVYGVMPWTDAEAVLFGAFDTGNLEIVDGILYAIRTDNGAPTWSTRFGYCEYNPIFDAVLLDDGGFVTFSVVGVSSNYWDHTLVRRFDADGAEVWTEAGEGSGNQRANAMAITSEAVYLVGAGDDDAGAYHLSRIELGP